jgi:colicin import membrane protein
MPRRERLPTKGRWRAVVLSILLHTGIVAAAVYGWFSWKHRPPEPTTLAIAATVVDERALKNLPPAPAPAPEPKPEPVPEPLPEPEPEPEPEEQGPPKPDPAELERKKEEERLAQEKLEQEKKQAEEQERIEAEKKEQERLEEEKKRAAARAAAEKAAAEKAAAEKKVAEKKKAEEAAAAKKAAEEKARLASEAELRRRLEAEERGNALRNSDEANRWHASIVAKIQRAWIKPPSAQPGVTCIVSVSQVLGQQGGEVTGVRVTSCSINDEALRRSVENAVLAASPLPPPPDPALFERNLELTFAPK